MIIISLVSYSFPSYGKVVFLLQSYALNRASISYIIHINVYICNLIFESLESSTEIEEKSKTPSCLIRVSLARRSSSGGFVDQHPDHNRSPKFTITAANKPMHSSVGPQGSWYLTALRSLTHFTLCR